MEKSVSRNKEKDERGNKREYRAHSLENLMEGHNWVVNQFFEIPRRSIVVYFLTLPTKGGITSHHLRSAVHDHRFMQVQFVPEL